MNGLRILCKQYSEKNMTEDIEKDGAIASGNREYRQNCSIFLMK